MKLIAYIALVLGSLLVAASLDAIPDPPAVNPHTVDVRAGGLRDLPEVLSEHRLCCASFCRGIQAPLLQIDSCETAKPNRSHDEIALVISAGDPSPPLSL